MKWKSLSKINITKEIIFQLILNLVVFTFYASDRKNPQIEEFEIVFFLNLAFIALIINYVLLPRFFFKEKYIPFAIYVLIAIGFAMFMEEAVLEQIFFPDTRAIRFPGVLHTLMGILPVVTILVGFKFAWDAFKKQKEVEKLKEAIKESELQFLKSQINPHFLFNNLNNLYAHAIEKSRRTPDIILELSAVLRYMLYDCKAAYVPLSKEINQLENYIKISEMQIEERGEVNFSVTDEGHNFQIAPLLLMVFLENAFKYCTASQSNGIYIKTELNVDQYGKLEFECVNSFEHQANVDQLSSGIGLKNVQKRLDLLYPKAHQLIIEESNNSFRVNLSMQLTTSI